MSHSHSVNDMKKAAGYIEAISIQLNPCSDCKGYNEEAFYTPTRRKKCGNWGFAPSPHNGSCHQWRKSNGKK